MSGNCSVCFDDLTPSNYLIVCWNSHSLCEDCYKRQKKPRRSLEGIRYATTCPECREEMFDWDLPQVARRVVVRKCGWCRVPGHDRRTCPLLGWAGAAMGVPRSSSTWGWVMLGGRMEFIQELL